MLIISCSCVGQMAKIFTLIQTIITPFANSALLCYYYYYYFDFCSGNQKDCYNKKVLCIDQIK